ncbi:MAG TPA: leucyl aminopeptidase [Planctomycetota bacterium]|nr:leucyl aminopeptidase [Planctomycetota bacterium]
MTATLTIAAHAAAKSPVAYFASTSDKKLTVHAPAAVAKRIQARFDSDAFHAGLLETLTFLDASGGPDSYVIGLGDTKKITSESFRRAGGQAVKSAAGGKHATVSIDLTAAPASFSASANLAALLEGAGLASQPDYKATGKKEDAPREIVKRVTVAAKKPGKVNMAKLLAGLEGAKLARSFGDMPPNELNPVVFARLCQAMARKAGLKCTVFDEKKLAAMGCGAICAVGHGSATPPRLITMEYRPKSARANAKPVVIVGKGVTFDTGGISIKPSDGMHEMKFDMCGAACVAGLMSSLKAAGIKRPVIGIIATVENMPGGRAYRPGDILRTLKGPTIEVQNTDAEGRLILADALFYAERFNPAAVIDLATLTGAILVSLGNLAAGLFPNDKELAQTLLRASAVTGERLHEMPMYDEYFDGLKCDSADIRNIAGRFGGSITAAKFLEHFIGDYKWAHLDIAGTAWRGGSWGGSWAAPYLPKTGASGFGVRLLLEAVENI